MLKIVEGVMIKNKKAIIIGIMLGILILLTSGSIVVKS